MDLKLVNGQLVTVNPRHIAVIEPLLTNPEQCCYVRTIAKNTFVEKRSGRILEGPAGYEVQESREELLARISKLQLEARLYWWEQARRMSSPESFDGMGTVAGTEPAPGDA